MLKFSHWGAGNSDVGWREVFEKHREDYINVAIHSQLINDAFEQSPSLQHIFQYIEKTMLGFPLYINRKIPDKEDTKLDTYRLSQHVYRFISDSLRSLLKSNLVLAYTELERGLRVPKVVPVGKYVIFYDEGRLDFTIVDPRYNMIPHGHCKLFARELPSLDGMLISPIARTLPLIIEQIQYRQNESDRDESNVINTVIPINHPPSVDSRYRLEQQNRVDMMINPTSDALREAGGRVLEHMDDIYTYQTKTVVLNRPISSLHRHRGQSSIPLNQYGGIKECANVHFTPHLATNTQLVAILRYLDERIYTSMGVPDLFRMQSAHGTHLTVEVSTTRMSVLQSVSVYVRYISDILDWYTSKYNDYYKNKQPKGQTVIPDLHIELRDRHGIIDSLPQDAAFLLLSQEGRREYVERRYSVHGKDVASTLHSIAPEPIDGREGVHRFLKPEAARRVLATQFGVDLDDVILPSPAEYDAFGAERRGRAGESGLNGAQSTDTGAAAGRGTKRAREATEAKADRQEPVAKRAAKKAPAAATAK